MAGDLPTAAAALEGVEASEGSDGAEVLLVQGHLAYFTGDYETARRVAEQARLQVLGGNWQALDLMSLQGLLAHQRGEWFDRIRLELRNTSLTPEVANAIFDGYLCPAEYLLYGSTPYGDVIQLARAMQATAEKSGALRAVAFARALVGESALLSGDLELASTELVEAAELHHVLGSGAGEAHCLQRLAEVRLAQGDSAEARRLLDQALPLARWSMIAMHLIQRIYGTMISAAPDAATARAIVDRAESTMGTEDSCEFCGIMLALPAMVACAHTGDLERAGYYSEVARKSSQLWEGTSWRAAFDEAQAHVTIAEGGNAIPFLDGAIQGFERAGQPIDVARATALRAQLV
jgi:tetratricopeptide (TPR) repeat protein